MSSVLEERYQVANKVTGVGTIINAILVIAKFSAGWFGRSQALMVDAVHSFSDFVTDAIILVSFRVSRKPEDQSHHFGHGKFETLSSLAISVSLVFVGLGLGYSGVIRVIEVWNGDIQMAPTYLALTMSIVAIVSKEWLFRYTLKKGKQISNSAVIANAYEHRSDAFSAIATTIGIAGAIILGGKWVILDSLAAVVVSIFILKFSLVLSYDSIMELTEASLSDDENKRILELGQSVNGVNNPHSLRSRKVGHYIVLNFHIEVDPNLTVVEAHEIQKRVKEKIRLEFGEGTMITIHIDPLDNKEAKKI